MAGADMPADDTLILVLSNDGHEIERAVASQSDAVSAAIVLLARRGTLRPGDTLRVMAPE
jgi:hypothetical protein